jgi:hypothetical protein
MCIRANVQSTIAAVQATARTLGLQLLVVDARTDSGLETAFAAFSQQHVSLTVSQTCGCYEPRSRGNAIAS